VPASCYMILKRLEYFPGVARSICNQDGALIVVTDPNEICSSHLCHLVHATLTVSLDKAGPPPRFPDRQLIGIPGGSTA